MRTPYLTGYEEHLRDEEGARMGDPRCCPVHPSEVTSSPDGLFDAPCGECEAAMEDDREEAPLRPPRIDVWDEDGPCLDGGESGPCLWEGEE